MVVRILAEVKGNEKEILDKLDAIASSLASVKPAEYTDKDLEDVYTAIEELRKEVDKLEESYHNLDKQTATFIDKLNSLEKDINDFELSEGVNEENTKAFVDSVITMVISAVVTYIFTQMKAW